jgi:hypothetical protein
MTPFYLQVRPASSLGIQQTPAKDSRDVLNPGDIISRTSSSASMGKGTGEASRSLFGGKPAPVVPVE